MAGSGTFSLEAAYIANGLIPGKCRDFALKHQPAFKEATWNFILKGSGDAVFNDVATPTIITSDISQRPIDIIRHNVECSPLAEIAATNPNAATINPQLKDFFSYTLDDIIASHTSPSRVTAPAAQTSILNHQSSIVLLNPPYGKRLDVNAPKLYTRIGRKLTELSQEAQACGTSLTVAILAPKDCTANLLKTCPTLDPLCNRKAKLIETSHGGFSLNAFIASL